MPARSIDARTSAIAPSPEEMPGSFCSMGERKLNGYHVFPAACGARYAKPGTASSSLSLRMSSAAPPRPCTITIAALARVSGSPEWRTG
jgi:hypothetical protein